MKSKITALLLFFLMPLHVVAGIVKTEYFTIDSFRISESTGNAYIFPTGNAEIVNSSCKTTAGYGFNKNDSLYSQMYAIALAAGSSGKKIKVWLSDSTGDCVSGYQKIKLIEIDF